MRRIKTGRVFIWLILKIAFLCNLWYNIRINRTALCRLFLFPASCGIFLFTGVKMQISDNGLSKLKQLEGAVKIAGRHVIYDDATGRPIAPNAPLPRGATIGYGHLIKSSENFTGGLTERAATELLRQDVKTAQRAVQNSITANLTQNQYDALVMLAYNIGAQNFSESTVVKYINNPDFHSAVYPNLESAWLAWNRYNGVVSNGLINRRQHEWNMYIRGIY